MRSKFQCIDLFSGCGGLALGLQRAGFEPKLFCELSDHAAETYLANHPTVPRSKDALKLANSLRDPSALMDQVGVGPGEIDLVCGGPPCQGYSRIGHRRTYKVEKTEIPSNHLFKAMVRIIRAVRPKMFLFENVSGILSSRWTEDGQPGEIFQDVLLGKNGFGGLMAKTSERNRDECEQLPESCGYLIRWREVRCSEYGVPQNRPRVLVVGIREDCAPAEIKAALSGSLDDPSDVDSYIDRDYHLIPRPAGIRPWDIQDILGDLAKLPRLAPNKATGQRMEYSEERGLPPKNKELRDWYLSDRGSWLNAAGAARQGEKVAAPKLTQQEYSRHKKRVLERFNLILKNATDEDLRERGLKTKKFAQRKLPATWGNEAIGVTVTSLPDDFVHYEEARILTVREWARLQTFPDWYEFKGPRTTGGTRRAGNPSQGNWNRDVPRYTQIGNAVPVMLAYRLGKHFASKLLRPEPSA